MIEHGFYNSKKIVPYFVIITLFAHIFTHFLYVAADQGRETFALSK